MTQSIKEKFYMNKSNIQNSSDMFLYKAQIDLTTAKYLQDAFNRDEIDIDIEKIYFELQQCSEKCLKSLLSKHSIKIPKIHDLEELIELCNDHNLELIDNVYSLIQLTDYAVDGRYSIIHDDIDDSENYIKLLETFITDISQKK